VSIPSLAEVVSFVRGFAGCRDDVFIGEDTRIDADLGITGLDGEALLVEAEGHFGVSLGATEDLRPVFGLKDDEVLFGTEGVGLPIPGLESLLRLMMRRGPSFVVRDLTVGELREAIVKQLGSPPRGQGPRR
jgi:hypothetical protein